MQTSSFDNFSDDWWNKDGSMRMLYSMNQTRLLFILERLSNRYGKQILKNLKNKKILDLGCGGGFLSESLATIGADITAIDSSKKLIQAAKERAKKKNLNIDYKSIGIKEIRKKKIKYDIVISLEVIEHVADYKSFLKDIFLSTKKNGLVIISTINRNYLSYLTTILLAEKIFRLVPNGVHDWNMYIKPEEILNVSKTFKFKLDKSTGMFPIPFYKNFQWIRTKNLNVNYIISLKN